MSTMIMDATGTTPPEYHCWLLNIILYVTHVLNHTAHESLNWKTPNEFSHGKLPDISPFLACHWWELVYFEAPPSKDHSPLAVMRFLVAGSVLPRIPGHSYLLDPFGIHSLCYCIMLKRTQGHRFC